ncbi:unnamed protein product, partial [Prorocentrum cordatum]
MALPGTILEFLLQPQGMVLFVAASALVTGIVFETILKSLTPWVATKEWWPRARPLQKSLMLNFGVPEAACDDFTLRQYYSYVIILCTHHLICGLMMVPVVAYGWTESRSTSQACFVVAVLMDVALNVYDWVRMFANTFLFESVGKKLFGGVEKGPLQMFIVLGVLHHTLALVTVCPLLLLYPDLASFHAIAMSLLLAGGICFTSGSYKFTLDLTKFPDCCQFKFIVALQATTILYTRGYVWFPQVYSALNKIWADGNLRFFCGGCAAAALMTLFNVLMILDAVGAAAKWLPRSMPKGTSGSCREPQEALSDGPRDASRPLRADAPERTPDLKGQSPGLPRIAGAARKGRGAPAP